MEADSVVESNHTHEIVRDCLEQYGRYVLSDRAIPALDGLKVGGRRTLWAMWKLGALAKKIPMKSAQVIGSAIGLYHPHGDTAAYGALVHMVHLRHPLVHGDGNFGDPNTIPEDGPAAQRYCVVGSTRIRLSDGTTKYIADLLPKAKPGSTNKLSVDILDWRGDAVRTDRLFHSGVHPVRTLRTKTGHEITGTGNHPLLCLVTDAGVPKLRWRTLDQIKPGTVVCVSRAYQDRLNVTPTKREKQIGILAGMLVSEGWASEKRVGFNNTDKEFYDLAVDAYKATIGGPCYSYERDNISGSHSHEFDVQKLSHFKTGPLADLLGQRSATKRIPKIIWESSLPTKRMFLRAVFEGDGSVCATPGSAGISYSTRSELLAGDIQQLLLEFGIAARVHHCRPKKGRNIEHVVGMGNTRSVRLFNARVGFLTRKQLLLENILATISNEDRRYAHSGDYIPYMTTFVRASKTRGHKRWLLAHNFDRVERLEQLGTVFFDKLDEPTKAVVRPLLAAGFFYDTVIGNKKTGKQAVYSVRVLSGDHSFLAGGFVNHNTECKLTALAERFFDDIDVMPMVPNFSETTEEPPLLPARLPMVLLNGVQGIAVGLSTSIPPHNLGEILDATLLVLRKPDCTVDDLIGVVKGPDYGYGVLTSRRQEIAELYDAGQGKLTFSSQFSIEDTDHRGVKKLVITGLAPEVKKNKLRDTIQDLHKRRLLESPLTDESTAKTGLRLTVEYRDAGILQARVLPLLESSVQYRWYCLDQDGTVKRFTLLQILQQFCVFRRDVETAVLKRRRKQLRHDLGVAEAKYAATQRLPEVVKILQDQRDEAAAKSALCRLLKVEDWQADVILGTTVRSLARYGADAIKNTITKIRTDIAEVQGSLGNIDEVVAARLEEMRQYSTPRGTALRTRTKDLGDAAKQWCGVGPDGTVDVSIDLPVKSKAQWRYCGFFAADKFVVIRADNTAAVVAPMYLDRYQAGPTVGATAAQYCLVADQDGRYCCFETGQRRPTFPVFRGQGKPMAVAGLNPGDRLLVVEQDGAVRWREFTDVKVTRPNVQPHRLLRSGQIRTVVQVPGNTTVMLTTGEELGSAEQVDPDVGILVVGASNLVVQDGRRTVMGRKEAIKAVQQGNCTAVILLPEEA